MTDEQPGGSVSAATTPQRPEPPGRCITRSRRHKVVGGVCGGLGRYFDLDPVIFRVPLAVVSVIDGIGFFVYGIAWLLLPFEDEEENEGRRMLSGRVEGPGLTALLTVVVGCGLMVASLPASTSSFFSMMALGMLVGAAYWSRYRRLCTTGGSTGAGTDPAAAQAVASAPPEVQAPPAPGTPSWWREPGAGKEPPAEEAYLWGPATHAPAKSSRGGGPANGSTVGAADAGGGPGTSDRPPHREGHGGAAAGVGQGGAAPFDPWQPPGGPVTPPEPERPFWLGGPVLLCAVLSAIVVTLTVWDGSALGTVLVYGTASALAVFGLGLVVGAFWGRIGTGTIIAAVLTGALLLGSASLPDTIPTERRDERWAPPTAADVEPRYEVGTGAGHLDLTNLELDSGDEVPVEVEAGAGEIRVVVPHEATVEVTTDVWFGVYRYEEPWQGEGSPAVSGAGFQTEWSGSFGPPPGQEASGLVQLELTMGLGHVVVERAAAPGTDGATEMDREPGHDGGDSAAGDSTAKEPGGPLGAHEREVLAP